MLWKGAYKISETDENRVGKGDQHLQVTIHFKLLAQVMSQPQNG